MNKEDFHSLNLTMQHTAKQIRETPLEDLDKRTKLIGQYNILRDTFFSAIEEANKTIDHSSEFVWVDYCDASLIVHTLDKIRKQLKIELARKGLNKQDERKFAKRIMSISTIQDLFYPVALDAEVELAPSYYVEAELDNEVLVYRAKTIEEANEIIAVLTDQDYNCEILRAYPLSGSRVLGHSPLSSLELRE